MIIPSTPENEARFARLQKESSLDWKAMHDSVVTGYEEMRDYAMTLQEALKGLMEAEEATIEDFNAKEIEGLETAMRNAREAMESWPHGVCRSKETIYRRALDEMLRRSYNENELRRIAREALHSQHNSLLSQPDLE